jgi:hypothetical protein
MKLSAAHGFTASCGKFAANLPQSNHRFKQSTRSHLPGEQIENTETEESICRPIYEDQLAKNAPLGVSKLSHETQLRTRFNEKELPAALSPLIKYIYYSKSREATAGERHI